DSLTPLAIVQAAFWMNFILAWVNLLPAFPLDGSRFLRALLWPRYGYRSAVSLVVGAAKIVAFLMFVAGVSVYNSYPFATLPLLLASVFLFFAAKQEAERLNDSEPSEASFNYDFSQGYTSLERQLQGRSREPGPVRRWLEKRREERARRQQLLEQDEERRVDEILARLHTCGRDGLSAEDRALLDRVSARYRGRQRG
ncbi:MAG TPA: site-2 protease family protein, partial [Pirellulales bacterium]|nr:site-2 protease family protein [Pirellulales bacterium]